MKIQLKLIIFALLLALPLAHSLEEIKITDTIDGDVVYEQMIIKIINNTEESFSIRLPSQAIDVTMNGDLVESDNSTYTTTLSCSTCYVVLTYNLPRAIRLEPDYLIFSRTLNFDAPKNLSYSIILPQGHSLFADSDPSAVPTPTAITTDGTIITVLWKEANPSLPKVYMIRYVEPVQRTSMWWIAIPILALVGLGGFLLIKRKAPKAPVYPAAVFTSDEKLALETLKDLLKEAGKKTVTQKEIARKLEWSKSKTSAICISLERKGIIKREKVGRNYRTELVGKVE